MFDVGDRDRVRERILDMASSDPRVVAGAVVGSFAQDEGDRWSDLDLTFAVADDVIITEVLEGWSQTLVEEFEAVQLFDLPRGPIIYRVFLLPDCLEVDLSFAPASAFGARGPNFRLLFGEAFEQTGEPTDPEELFGYAVHHVLHARIAIERGRHWLAEYWISAVRDYALELACLRRGLDGSYGRDFDRLPADVLEPMNDALVRSLERGELNRVLRGVVDGLLRESAQVGQMAERVEGQLRELATARTHHGIDVAVEPEPVSTHMSAIALITTDAGVLMVESRYPGMDESFWALPGGMLEPGEDIHSALTREVAEETGLIVGGSSTIVGTIWLVTNKPAAPWVTFICEPSGWTGELSPDDPDGVTLHAAFMPIEQAIERLDSQRWGLSEPISRRLLGAPPGGTWVYRWNGLGPWDGNGPAQLIRGPA